ncbi:MAG: hypothetical protein NZ455_02590 [Bacteroidia bacterium]|nr:hypothetical protein [Bacteroidia bacterium]MDW8348468.1 hypothetical protein [Bacteroidia bacterium]
MRRVRQQCVAQAKHRSDSAARSTPTRALARDTPKNKLKPSKRVYQYICLSILNNLK